MKWPAQLTKWRCAAIAFGVLWLAAGVSRGHDDSPHDESPMRRLPPTSRPATSFATPSPPASPHSFVAYDPSIAERLERLETAWQEMEDAKAAEEEKEDKNVYEAPTRPTFNIGGRVHLDHWGFPQDTPGIGFFENPTSGEDPEDRFAFRRIRIEMAGEIFETMVYRMQIEFATPDEPAIRDVYIGWDELPHNQMLLIGNQKRPLGLDSLNSSRFNVFMERPMVIDADDEDYRRLGVCMYGHSDDLIYTWRYGVYNLDNIQQSGQYIGDSLQLSGNGRLSCCPWYDECSDGRGYLHLAVAGMVARPDGDVAATDDNNNEARFRTRPEARSTNRWIDTGAIAGADWYEIAAAEFMLNVGPWQVVSEYQTTWVQRDNSTPGTGPSVNFHGAYVQIAWFLTGEFTPYDRETAIIGRVHPYENFFLVSTCDGCRGTGWGAWQIALRYSYLDLSDEDILGGDERNVTLGLNWWWTSHSRLQLNAVRGQIDQHAPVGGFTSGDFWIVGTRLMVDF